MPATATLQGFGWRPVSRRRPIVTDLDLRIAPGERVLLAGPSGAGKSTVLRALAGVLGTTVPGEVAGDVRVDGIVGLLAQNPGDSVVADRIGRDVAFGMENAGTPRDRMWPRVRTALDAVRLDYPVEHPTAALSGGETQRLALAGVLALRPGLLLLDEPTSMLDAASAVAVRRAVLDSVEQTGASLLVVEHRIAEWLPLVDRVVVLDRDAAVTGDLSPEALVRERSADLADAGVWMPGLPPPEPLPVPAALTRPDEGGTAIRAIDLHVDLRTRTIREPVTTQAVRGVDARLEPATLTALTGQSGSGKSTLLAASAGLVAPTAGRITLGDGGEPPHRMRSAVLARSVGWVPQNPEHGFLTTRVRDEIVATAGVLGRAVDADAVLDLFGLGHLAEANPYLVSGGEQRRVALAAALAHRPGAALLDEPTVGQDRGTWAAVAGWLVSARGADAATAVATHDAGLVGLADVEHPLAGGRAA